MLCLDRRSCTPGSLISIHRVVANPINKGEDWYEGQGRSMSSLSRRGTVVFCPLLRHASLDEELLAALVFGPQSMNRVRTPPNSLDVWICSRSDVRRWRLEQLQIHLYSRGLDPHRQRSDDGKMTGPIWASTEAGVELSQLQDLALFF